MLTALYNEIYNLLFAGENMPAIFQQISVELCTILSMIMLTLVLIIPFWVVFRFIRVVFSGGEFFK